MTILTQKSILKEHCTKNKALILNQSIFVQTKHKTKHKTERKTYLPVIFLDVCDAPKT